MTKHSLIFYFQFSTFNSQFSILNMIHHYFKIAFRNLRKYRTQNMISIIGLAVGFVCFALSAIWIRYEMSYDDFHPKADRIYLVQNHPNKWNTQNADSTEISSYASFPLVKYLKDNFPEIEDICIVNSRIKAQDITVIDVDASFFNIFDLPKPPLSGFFERGSIQPALITDLKHTEFVKNELKLESQGITKQWPANTNIPFQVITPLWTQFTEEQMTTGRGGGGFGLQAWVLLHKGIDLAVLHKKIDKIMVDNSPKPMSVFLTPIKKLHYTDPSKRLKSEIKFNHILIFSLSGLLVILCALFNHITLYISQMKMRLREFALRKVNGSSNGQIIRLLYLEFLIVLFISLILGSLALTFCIPYFKEYAEIGSSSFSIIGELLIYAFGILLFAFLMGLIPILHFRKRTLQEPFNINMLQKTKTCFVKSA